MMMTKRHPEISRIQNIPYSFSSGKWHALPFWRLNTPSSPSFHFHDGRKGKIHKEHFMKVRMIICPGIDDSGWITFGTKAKHWNPRCSTGNLRKFPAITLHSTVYSKNPKMKFREEIFHPKYMELISTSVSHLLGDWYSLLFLRVSTPCPSFVLVISMCKNNQLGPI